MKGRPARLTAKLAPLLVTTTLLFACGPDSVWERAEWRVHEQELADAVARFHADVGEYPYDLRELVPEYLAELRSTPEGRPVYLYDPDSGAVQVVPAIAPAELARIKADDEAKVAAINKALEDFRQDQGVSPLSLDELMPEYLASLPEGATVASDYYYSAASGTAMLPPELQEIYDSLSEPSEADLAPVNIRETYDGLIDELDAIDQLSEGEGYSDSREVLAEGTTLFEQRGDSIGQESGTPEAGTTASSDVDTSAIDRYESNDPAALPSPGEVLEAGKQVFHELYGTESDPDLKQRSEELYDDHVDDEGNLDTTQTPTAEEVLEAGKEIFHLYEDATSEQ